MTEEQMAHNAALDRDYYQTEAVWYVPTARETLRYAFDRAPDVFRAYLEDCDRENTTVSALLQEFAEEAREDIAAFCGEA